MRAKQATIPIRPLCCTARALVRDPGPLPPAGLKPLLLLHPPSPAACIAGHFFNHSTGDCQPCPYGTFNPANGSIDEMTSCQVCDEGLWTDTTGATECTCESGGAELL